MIPRFAKDGVRCDVARATNHPSLAPATAAAAAAAMPPTTQQPTAPCTTRKAAHAAKALTGCVALLVLAVAPSNASSQHRHERDTEPSARAPRGNQTTAAARPAPAQEHPPAMWTLRRAWLANQTLELLALAAHGPIAALDTSGETNLAGVFYNAADFGEDLNAYVCLWRARLCLL